MAKSETPARDAVLVKYLNEAYGKEKQLTAALQAQIRLAKRPQLKKGLQDHLKVTRDQAKQLEKRIKALGGKADASSIPGPGPTEAVTGLANQALALAKGPVQALRGTSEADNELRNVRDCYWNEAEEIAHYAVIESVATELGDSETAKLARQFRKQEEQMQKLLERQIPQLVKAVVKEEVPSAERRNASGRYRSSSRSSSSSRSTSSTRSSSTRSTSSSSRSTKGSSTKGSTAKKTGTAKRSGSSSSRRKTASKS